MPKRVRVLVAKLGLDQHYFGAQAVASGLRDAGMEVILVTGVLTPEEVAQIAVEEDVDIVGISILCGNYLYLLPECVRQLRERGKGDVLVIAGGIIDRRDFASLKEQGIAEIWLSGSPVSDMVKFIEAHFEEKAEASKAGQSV